MRDGEWLDFVDFFDFGRKVGFWYEIVVWVWDEIIVS